MKFTLVVAAAIAGFGAIAQTADPVAHPSRSGAPKVDGTEKVGQKTVPAIFWGGRKISNNYDIVDVIGKAQGATATVFVEDGNDLVRVPTNLLTPESKRGVGTQLAS